LRGQNANEKREETAQFAIRKTGDPKGEGNTAASGIQVEQLVCERDAVDSDQ
jgi:hypothetical protein